MKQILCLPISNEAGASARYRLYQYEPMLTEAGYNLAICPPTEAGKGLKRVLNRRKEENFLIRCAENTDVVFIQKRLFSESFIRRLQETRKPILFDIDDAIFTVPGRKHSQLTQRRVTRRFQTILKASSLVLAGNEFLADKVREYTPSVEVLPTVVNLEKYKQSKRIKNTNECVLGWMGSKATHRYLELLTETLKTALKSDSHLKLVVVSNSDFQIPGCDVECRSWSEMSEIDDLLSFDIGLMPLEDNIWSRGKCALKALQYMATGIPSLSTPVGVVTGIIRHGENGFLCSTPEEWQATIHMLASDPDLRYKIGEAAKKTVEEEYSMEITGKKLMALLAGI